MKRLVNVRIPLMLAIALVFGIALGFLFVYYGISLFWLTAVLPATAVIIILLTLFGKKFSKVFFVLIIAIFFVCGAVNTFVRLENFKRCEIVSGQIYSVSGTVCEKGENSSGEYVILKNVNADRRNIDGKLIVFLGKTYGEYCDVGYKVSFSAAVERKDLFAYGKLNYYAQDNVKYGCFVNDELTAKYGYSFFGSIRSHIRDTLYENLDGDTAAVAFAMLTGNTQGVENGTIDSFRYGGIAHIFAVSGLHIGILYGALYSLFKKLKLNKYFTAAICITSLFFYAGICGFTLSSVRAAVMCTVSALAKLTHKKYDSLNALSVSVIIILTVAPLSLFSVGFQLSVCATGSIILLSKSIARSVARPFKKLPKKVAGAIGVSLSAQAGTLPVMLLNLGYLSGAGMLLNIVVLPVLSVVYVILFVATVISAVIPVAAVILQYFALPLQLTVSAIVNAGFENALLSGFGAGAFLPVYYLGLFALSDKINLKLIQRLTAIFSALIFICIYVPVRTFALFSGFKITVSAYYGGGEVLIKSNSGNILIITEELTPSQTQIMLNEYYANNLTAVIILGGENCVMAYGNFDLNCKNIYVYYGYINVQPYSCCTVNYENEFCVGGVNFSFADGYSLLADCNGVSVAVCAGDFVPFESCDLLICDSLSDYCNSTITVGFNERNIEYNVYDCGDFVFNVRGKK